MRHTLLPPQERKALHNEYNIRLFIVTCLMLVIPVIVGIVSLFPSYMKVTDTKSDISSKAEEIRKNAKKAGYENALNELKSDTKMASQILANKNIPLSTVVETISSIRGNIKITSIAFAEPNASSTIIADLQGISPDRASLLSFRSRLETASGGSKVDIPISSLTQSKNIPFNVKVTLKIK